MLVSIHANFIYSPVIFLNMNLNEKAVKIAEKMVSESTQLKIGLVELENGSKIIDCGIKYEGSFEAGSLFALACMGGLAEITIGEERYGDFSLAAVKVKTDHPAISCLASQKAGWSIKGKGFFALGSGPARILAKKPRETFEKIGYTEESAKTVIALECSRYPPPEVCTDIARACGVDPEGLYVLAARTASLTSTVQISARAIETCLYKIDRLGYDVKAFVKASGTAPIAPLVRDDVRMMGIANDMIIYGSKVSLDSKVAIEVEDIPSSSSPAYGKPFAEIFEEAGYDFYRINPAIFAPAEVLIKNTRTGEEGRAGRVNPEIIKKSFGL
jgi:methenyltetrahydromethanopterin cyclohydrolase